MPAAWPRSPRPRVDTAGRAVTSPRATVYSANGIFPRPTGIQWNYLWNYNHFICWWPGWACWSDLIYHHIQSSASLPGQPLLALLSFLLLCVALVTINHPRCQHRAARRAATAARTQCSGGISTSAARIPMLVGSSPGGDSEIKSTAAAD